MDALDTPTQISVLLIEVFTLIARTYLSISISWLQLLVYSVSLSVFCYRKCIYTIKVCGLVWTTLVFPHARALAEA